MKLKIASLFLFASIFAHSQEEETFPRPPTKEITVESQPWVKNCMAEPYLEADFLYWKVVQGGLEYASTGFGGVSEPVTSKGKIYLPDFEGKLGFRVGLGMNLAHNGWDVLLRYTWIYSNVNDHIQVNLQNERIRGLWVHAPFEFLHGGISNASVRWDVHMNMIDFEWGRGFYISRFLTLRPFFGLKGFWSDQGYRTVYSGFIDDERTQRGDDIVNIDQDIWGIGVRFGINTAWYFVRNWSVFGDFAITNGWTHFDVHRRDRGINLTLGDDIPLINSRLDEYFIVPIVELAAGVRWEMWFDNDSYHVLIQAGWEEQIWWDMNRYPAVFDNTGGAGNLQFQGLTLKFRFDF